MAVEELARFPLPAGSLIMDVAVSPGGVVAVALREGPEIRFYRPSGGLIRAVRSARDGPEFEFILGVAALVDGTFAAWDPRRSFITVLDTLGGVLRTHRVRSRFFGSNALHADSAGRFYVLDRVGEQGGYRVLGPDGTEIGFLPVPDYGPSDSFVLPTPEGFLRPFTRGTPSTISPLGYVVLGHNDSYTIELRIESGPMKLQRSWTPVRVSAAEKSEWAALAAAINRSPGGPPVSTRIPDTKPAFRSLAADMDGRIWVDRYVEASREYPTWNSRITWLEARTYDVIDPSGLLLGTVVLSPTSMMIDARGDTLWTLERSQLPERYVVKYRLRS